MTDGQSSDHPDSAAPIGAPREPPTRPRKRKLAQWLLAYAAGAWVLIQVLSLMVGVYHWTDAVLRVAIAGAVVGLFLAAVLAWYHAEQGRQRVSSGESALLALIMIVGVAGIWLSERGHSAAAPGLSARSHATAATAAAPSRASGKSIAVLPFVSMSDAADNEFFSDGLSEEILNSLARIPGMQVVGRTSSFQFKGKNTDLREIGRSLGVANVLEGSVRREGDRARITAQLIRTSDGIHLWSETYDRTLKDTLAIQLDIAEQVAGALDVVLDAAQRERMRTAGVGNVDAFIAYQKGLKLFGEAHSGPNLIAVLHQANAEFDKAVALEPRFALAHFMSSDMYEHQLLADGGTAAGHEAARRAALQRIDLALAATRDPQQRLFMQVDRKVLGEDWSGLGALIEAAIAAPGCTAPNWLPQVGDVFGYGAGYLPVARRVIDCDPLNPGQRVRYAESANAAGPPALALATVEQAEQAGLGSTGLTLQAARALAAMGRIDEARKRLAAAEPAGELYAMSLVVVEAAAGFGPAEIRNHLKSVSHGKSGFDLWSAVDFMVAATTGDRREVNRRATAYDARAGGTFQLVLVSQLCQCGAPFDLQSTPNFKAQLAGSGLAWPPKATIRFPAREAASGQAVVSPPSSIASPTRTRG